LRPCLGLPGQRCHRFIERGRRCESCRAAFERGRDNARPAFERTLYGSAAWQKLRREVLADGDGLCAHCRRAPATSADHLVSVRSAPHLALTRSNVVPSCASCQRLRQRRPALRQTTMYEAFAAQSRPVYGPPGRAEGVRRPTSPGSCLHTDIRGFQQHAEVVTRDSDESGGAA